MYVLILNKNVNYLEQYLWYTQVYWYISAVVIIVWSALKLFLNLYISFGFIYNLSCILVISLMPYALDK